MFNHLFKDVLLLTVDQLITQPIDSHDAVLWTMLNSNHESFLLTQTHHDPPSIKNWIAFAGGHNHDSPIR